MPPRNGAIDPAQDAPVPQGRRRRFLHLGRAVGEMAAGAAGAHARPGVPLQQRGPYDFGASNLFARGWAHAWI